MRQQEVEEVAGRLLGFLSLLSENTREVLGERGTEERESGASGHRVEAQHGDRRVQRDPRAHRLPEHHRRPHPRILLVDHPSPRATFLLDALLLPEERAKALFVSLLARVPEQGPLTLSRVREKRVSSLHLKLPVRR